MPPGIAFCVAPEVPPPPVELGPLPFPPPPPGRGVGPLDPFAPRPPGPRDPAATASLTFDNAPDPGATYCVATTPAPTAAKPTPMPTPARSPPLIEATPPSIAAENLDDIQHTQRNITAAAAKSNPVRAGSGDVAAFCATAIQPCETVIPAPTSK